MDDGKFVMLSWFWLSFLELCSYFLSVPELFVMFVLLAREYFSSRELLSDF